MQDKIRIFRVLRYVLPHYGTNNVYLEVFLTGPVESSFCQRGSKTCGSQFFRDFRVDELQDISAQAVFKIGDFTVPLDFYAARRYQMQRQGLTAK
jgi:hypothetical protein